MLWLVGPGFELAGSIARGFWAGQKRWRGGQKNEEVGNWQVSLRKAKNLGRFKTRDHGK